LLDKASLAFAGAITFVINKMCGKYVPKLTHRRKCESKSQLKACVAEFHVDYSIQFSNFTSSGTGEKEHQSIHTQVVLHQQGWNENYLRFLPGRVGRNNQAMFISTVGCPSPII
jgi:hypothetical protein